MQLSKQASAVRSTNLGSILIFASGAIHLFSHRASTPASVTISPDEFIQQWQFNLAVYKLPLRDVVGWNSRRGRRMLERGENWITLDN